MEEAPDLKTTIQEQDWEETCRILKDHPQLIKKQLSEFEFQILWFHAPLETIRVLLRASPESYKVDSHYGDLVEVKSNDQEWDFLDIIFKEFPQVREMNYARTAAKHGASLDFLEDHWKEAGTVFYSVHSTDWVKFREVLNDNIQIVKAKLSEYEFDILWVDAPLKIVRALLEVWPEAYEMKGWCGNLVETKIYNKQWDFLKSILPSCPNSITAEEVKNACYNDAPIDVFKLVLDQQPNAPLEQPIIIFRLIEKNKLGHFCAVLDRCSAATEVKEPFLHLTPLLCIFQIKKTINVDWIGPILRLNPDSAKQKDFDGKTALHLSYQHGASSELISMIQKAHPDAENERDNLGRFPKDLANLSSKTAFTAANETLILRGNLSIEKSYADDAVVVCRGDMLIRDPQTAENKEDKQTYENYSEHVLARDRIFSTLLDEFSKMVGINDKDVIQKAAVIQALAVQFLSNQDDTIISFGTFGNPGYWHQQEVLKLVMRVFFETQGPWDSPFPSITYDANECTNYLDNRKNGRPSPEPSDGHVKAYGDLNVWLTEGLDTSSYTLQGPVLKPLQSLFNKLFIRRGQASVSVIGDMVRGTLLVDDMEPLQAIVKKIKNTFPNITENQFRQPDQFDKLADFLAYVHDDLNVLPGSDDVLPYRFKANSSQKKKEEPLWYNLNFFLQIPEYHRVGFSEMFVACELQIGLTEEINKHRNVHVAYERDRILSNQPLLKNYDALTKEEKDEDKFSRLSNCTEDDNKLIEKVLFGKIATEVLLPCATADNDDQNNTVSFEVGPFSLSEDEFEAGSFVIPERLCLNDRCLNWHAIDCPKENDEGCICAACVVAGPYELDQTKRYFVDSFVCENLTIRPSFCTVGLYAHVGPYSIQIACSEVESGDERGDTVMVKSGRNFSYLEQLCPVPVSAAALEVIFYGHSGDLRYDAIKLSLKVFDIY